MLEGTSCRSASWRACVAWWPTRRVRSSRGRSSRTSARACPCWSTSSPRTVPARDWPTPRCGPPTRATSRVVWSTWPRSSSSAKRTAAPIGRSRSWSTSPRPDGSLVKSAHVDTSVFGRVLAEDVKVGSKKIALSGRRARRRGLGHRGRVRRRHRPGSLGHGLRGRGRRVRHVLRPLAGVRSHGRHRRGRRHHRGAVDRRARHAAHDADLPHRRCRRRGHHARSAACRRAVRGAQAQGRGADHRALRHGRHRGRRREARASHHGHRRLGRHGGVPGLLPGPSHRVRTATPSRSASSSPKVRSTRTRSCGSKVSWPCSSTWWTRSSRCTAARASRSTTSTSS